MATSYSGSGAPSRFASPLRLLLLPFPNGYFHICSGRRIPPLNCPWPLRLGLTAPARNGDVVLWLRPSVALYNGWLLSSRSVCNMNSTTYNRAAPTGKAAGRSSKSLDTVWIILIVFAVLAAVGLLVLAVCCIRRRKQKPRAPAAIPRRERPPAGTVAVRIGESGAGRLRADTAAVRIDEIGTGRLSADAAAVRIGESGAGRLPADAAAVRIGESGVGRLSADAAVVHTGESSGAGEGAGVQATGCPICGRPYEKEPSRWAPERLNCGHVFHGQCIKPWVAVNLACPVCNKTHINLFGKTPGDAARHRYSFSHLESSVTTKDDIAVGSLSFRQHDWV